MIYLDNASTSYPKPLSIIKEMTNYLTVIGVNPYRGNGTHFEKANRIIFSTREKLAALFRISNENHISFTYNATHASNIILKGFLKDGDHVLVTNFEHNGILRPLARLAESKNISYSIIDSDEKGRFFR